MSSVAPYTISLIVACVVSAIILLFGIAVIWQIWTGGSILPICCRSQS
jgi:hypothetical protein